MENPLVSIALCTYNGEKFIEEQLLSLINQTYTNLQIIVFDDASTDATIRIIKKYSINDARIKINENFNNVGYIKNFESAIAVCTGKYIFLSDQDDIWAIDKVSNIVAQFDEHTTIIFHDSEFVNSFGISIGKKLSDRFTLNQKITPLSFLLFNGIPGHALAFDCSIIKNVLPLTSLVHHDCWISFIATCKGEIKYLSNTYVKYRQHENSETDLLKIKSQKLIKESSLSKNLLLIDRTNHFASIAFNPQQKHFIRFRELLIKRQSSFFCFTLFYFIIRHHQSIFTFKKKKGILRLFYAFPYIWGIKSKLF